MTIRKCDMCKKEINDQYVADWAGFYADVELCQDCGSPILGFLQRYKFIKKEEKNKFEEA